MIMYRARDNRSEKNLFLLQRREYNIIQGIWLNYIFIDWCDVITGSIWLNLLQLGNNKII